MSSSYGPALPAPAQQPPPMPWHAPGGPGWPGTGQGAPPRPPHRHRALAVTAACVALLLAAALALALHSDTTAAPRKAVSRTAEVATAVDRGLADVVATLGYQSEISAGTGLVVTSSGEVLTNNHVIEGATSVQVTDVGNGRTYPATVVGYDQAGDIAVLQASGASGLGTLPLRSPKVTVGESVIALGNAGGKGGTPAVATGKVTGLNQSITATDEAENSSEQLSGLIRTSVPLQAGYSGGPLVTTAGTVIGVDTAASSGYQVQAGSAEGFAIPIGQVVSVAGQIGAARASATVHIGATAFLGVQVSLYAVPFTSQTNVVVVATMAGLPAANAGLQPGDVILSVNGQAVTTPASIQNLLEPCHPGDQVSIGWLDVSGQAHTATVVLAAGPAG